MSEERSHHPFPWMRCETEKAWHGGKRVSAVGEGEKGSNNNEWNDNVKRPLIAEMVHAEYKRGIYMNVVAIIVQMTIMFP